MIGFWIFDNNGKLLTNEPCDELLFGLVKSVSQLTLNLSNSSSSNLVTTPPIKCLKTGKYTLQIQTSLSGKILVIALKPEDELLPQDTLVKVISYIVKNPMDVSLDSLKQFQL